MTAPSQLAKWREAREWSPRKAARHFAISLEFYTRLEAGKVECPGSLAMSIAQKTNMVVMPGDLPGCEITSSGAAPSPGDCREAASGTREMDAGERHAPPAAGVSGEEAVLPAASSSQPLVWLQRTDAGFAIAMDGATPLMAPEAAAQFGMDLIRAALLAVRPGSVPI